MQRFFLTPDHFSGGQVTFPRDIAHQIIHVLRLGEGDQVSVLDNTGMIYQVGLRVNAADMTVAGTIEASNPVTTEPKTQIALYFGLSSREKVEWILQKGTEIGVSAFVPFVSLRTLVKSTLLSPKRYERWTKIIREAAEQSERGRLPLMHLTRDLADCFFEANKIHGLCLIAWEEAQAEVENLAGLLKDFEGGSIALFVGPEGGFSEGEIVAGKGAGCQVVSLGVRILRMETAAIVFPALVLHDLGQ